MTVPRTLHSELEKDKQAIHIIVNKTKMVKYFTPDEVAIHNCAEDCWISIYDNVFNLTSLIAANRGVLADPIIREAGRSVSHWFNPKTGDIKTFVDPVRNIVMPYTPDGRFIHVPPADPTDWDTEYELPWWKDPQYMVGKVVF